MNIKEAILHRRLIKTEQMNGAVIDDSLVKELLQFAHWAPTHGYTEPWRFVIYRKEEIQAICRDHANLYQANSPAEKYSASTYEKIAHRGDLASHLVICYAKKGNNPKVSMHEEICATACAIQNLWLLAASHNIGIYWGTGGMVHHPSMKEYLQIDSEDVVMGFLFLGYTDIDWPKGRRISSIEDHIRWS